MSYSERDTKAKAQFSPGNFLFQLWEKDIRNLIVQPYWDPGSQEKPFVEFDFESGEELNIGKGWRNSKGLRVEDLTLLAWQELEL